MDIYDICEARKTTFDAYTELLSRGKIKAAWRMRRLFKMYDKMLNHLIKAGYTMEKISEYIPKVDDAAFEAVTDDLVKELEKQ